MARCKPGGFGLDMVLGCFLLTMALGGPITTGFGGLVAAVSALAAWKWLPPEVVGALAGLIGLFWLGQAGSGKEVASDH